MTNPDSFDTAWTQGELAAFNLLCTATGVESGKGAFIGRDFDIANGFWFASTIGGVNGEVLLNNTDLPNMVARCQAELVFQSRAKVQEAVSAIIRALPVRSLADTNIAEFRVSSQGVSDITGQYEDVPKMSKQVLLWRCRVSFELVFSTGGKANSI
jgi:hypothetical protein